MNIKPTCIFVFEQTELQSLSKLQKCRLDPKTGTLYNLDLVRMKDPHLTKLMQEAGSDSALLTQIGLGHVPAETLEILRKDSPDAAKVDGEILTRLVPREIDAPQIAAKRWDAWQKGAAVVEDKFQCQIIDVGTMGVSELLDVLCSKVIP